MGTLGQQVSLSIDCNVDYILTISRMMREGSLGVEGVNWDEAALYLALTITRTRIEELGLGEVVPARR